jgi:hypothetical protein
MPLPVDASYEDGVLRPAEPREGTGRRSALGLAEVRRRCVLVPLIGVLLQGRAGRYLNL